MRSISAWRKRSLAVSDKERFLLFLGLARRAGRVIMGAPMVYDALREKPPALVLLAEDASSATEQRMTNKCGFYRTPLLKTECTKEELAHAVGKTAPMAALAVTDRGMAEKLKKISGKEASAVAESE